MIKEVDLMKNQVNRNQLGLTVGTFFALCHAIWVVFVGVGFAKPLIDWIIPLHFIDMSYSITVFSLGSAVTLVILAFLGGYISGWVLAGIWNWASKKVR